MGTSGHYLMVWLQHFWLKCILVECSLGSVFSFITGQQAHFPERLSHPRHVSVNTTWTQRLQGLSPGAVPGFPAIPQPDLDEQNTTANLAAVIFHTGALQKDRVCLQEKLSTAHLAPSHEFSTLRLAT